MKKETEEKMIALALSRGFTEAAVIGTDALVFRPEYRRFCEENRCGNYGRNYACPPASGTPGEMAEAALRHRRALVLKTRMPVRDAMDPAETGPLKDDHSRRSRALFKQLRNEGITGEGTMVLAGPCGLCKPCGMAEGRPCPFPAERASCLSAYCLDVAALAGAAGMDLSWDMNQASFFSLWLFDGDELIH